MIIMYTPTLRLIMTWVTCASTLCVRVYDNMFISVKIAFTVRSRDILLHIYVRELSLIFMRWGRII